MSISSHRTLLLVAAVGMTMHGVILSLGGPILPSLMEDFALREAQAGILLASGSAGFLIGTLASGFLVDRRGLKEAFLLGQGVEMVSLGGYGMAPTFPAALAAALILGVGAGIIETTLNTLPTHMASQQAGSLMNLIHLFFSLGAFTAPLIIGTLLGSGWMWRGIYWMAVIPVASLGLAVLGVRFPRPPSQMGHKKQNRQTAWMLLRQRPVILGALVLLFYAGAELGIAAWVILYLQQELHLPIGLASLGLSIFWITMVIGRFMNSRLALRFSARDLTIASGLGGAVCCWGLLTTGRPLVAFGWLALAGLLLSGVYPLAMAAVNSLYPLHAGRVSGLLAACAAGGSLLFPPLLGTVAQETNLRLAMGLNGLWMVGVALSFAPMPHKVPLSTAHCGAEE